MRPVSCALAVASFLCVAIGGQLARGTDAIWPGWMGPKRDGWVKNVQLPSTGWPRLLTKVWQVDVGTGYASPIVANGKVFQHSRQGDNEVLRCLDLRTGRPIWSQNYPVPFKIGGGGEKHGKGPKSSPVIAGGRVFTMSITGILSAWNASTGARLWQREDGTQSERNHPYWGAATSPIVDGDRVIVHFGTDDEGVLVALDTASGKEIWRQGNDGASYSSPLIVEIQGVRQVIEWNHRSVVGVAIDSGQLLWHHPFPHTGSNQNMPTPAFHEGQVLVGGENRGILCLQPRLVDGIWNVQERWHQDEVALDMSTGVVNDGRLYGFSHYGKGRIFCLNIESGEILWQGKGRTGENVAFLSMPGYVAALIDDGQLRIMYANGQRYHEVASYRVADNSTWAPPVLLGSDLLVKDEAALTLWSLSDAD